MVIVVRADADEDPCQTLVEGGRIDACTLDDLPGGFEQQPVLRADCHRLAGTETEEGAVEQVRMREKAAALGVRGADGIGVRAVQPVERPSAVFRESRGRIDTTDEQLPELFWGRDVARI